MNESLFYEIMIFLIYLAFYRILWSLTKFYFFCEDVYYSKERQQHLVNAINELLSLAGLERTKYIFNCIIDSDVSKALNIFVRIHIYLYCISFIFRYNLVIDTILCFSGYLVGIIIFKTCVYIGKLVIKEYF
jgi:hypothetical protein